MKTTITSTIRLLAAILALPIIVSHWSISRITSPDSSLESHSQLLSLIPGKFGNYMRNAFYRSTLYFCDPTATICFGVLISKTSVSLGANSYIGPRCMLGWVTIKENVLLAPGVQILSGSRAHTFDSLAIPIRDQPRAPRCVTIGADSWIGAAAVVLADVGVQSVVGANSTVTKPVPDRTIAVGCPARTVRKRNQERLTPVSNFTSSKFPAVGGLDAIQDSTTLALATRARGQRE